ncbi:MAG TPA: ECF transporter S component [Pseudogracilibacillus sp.]|nr:ECF transporter S component [Pseudogracilibacillus sp.]
MRKWWSNYLIFILLIPMVIWVGVTFFDDRKYVFISFMLVLLSLIPVLLSYENRKVDTRMMVVLAILIALSSISRVLFAPIPGFKPVSAIVILTAIYFRSEAGFLVGALTALISNIYFGQGPWTPFQMFSWGIIGFLAGLPHMRQALLKNKLILSLYGVFAGIIYSLLMDIWTVLSIDGTFNVKRYVGAIALSTPFMITYAVSNVIFLLLTVKPIGEKLERIKIKYGVK